MSPDPRTPPAIVSLERLEDLERRAPPCGLTWLELAIAVAIAASSLTVLALKWLGRIL